MFKILVILTIVFVNCCEINADLQQLRKKQTTAAWRRINNKNQEDSKRIRHQTTKDDSETQTTRYTTGSGKNMSGLYLESFQNNNEGFFNYFKQGVVVSHRFSPVNNVEESSQTEELGNESTKSQKSYVNLRRSKTHQSTNNIEKEDMKKNVKKKNDSSSFIKSSSDRKHHEHKNRFKIMDRNHSEKSKHITRRQKDHINKDKHGKEKNKDKKEAKTKVNYNNLLKGTTKMIISVSEENKNISTKGKEKRKDKLKIKGMDRDKDKSETIKQLQKEINIRIKQATSKDKHKEKSGKMVAHKLKGGSMNTDDDEKKRTKDKKKEESENIKHSEKNNKNKTKHAEKRKTKAKQESKQSKSKDALRTAKTNTTAVLKKFQASTRVSKRAQKTTTKKNFRTSKPPPKLFQKDRHKEKSLVVHKDKGESVKTDDHKKKRGKEKSMDEKGEDRHKEKSTVVHKDKGGSKKTDVHEKKRAPETSMDKKKEKSENMKHVSEKNNVINITKQAKEKSMTKLKQENKQSNSKDDLRTAKTNIATVLKQSKTSTKDSKRAKNTTTIKNFSTPKPPPKLHRHPMLRSNKRVEEEPIRATQMSALYLKEDTKGALRDAGNDIEGLPSNLSPYAITAQIELLMKEFLEANASVTKIGSTIEYNDIVLVTIKEKEKDQAFFRTRDSKYMDEVPEKKIIFIVHGLTVMGLREMTSLVKISELKILLSYYLKHLDKFDIYLMPLANPDGYSASLSSSSILWNKNISPQEACSGVFVDRNFDVAWKSSQDISSCSQLYPGATPFSEEESKAVREIFHNYGHKILAYIHVHAGTFDAGVFKGDAVLYPRGYTETQSDDDKYIDLKGEIDEAMKNARFRVISVTVDSLASWYGVVTGTSVDYAASVYGIPYAMEFVMQIYDPESLINDALTEIWSRLIDTTFNNMWKSLQKGADTRKSLTNN